MTCRFVLLVLVISVCCTLSSSTVVSHFVCFFLQAEDGIRDAQESRGLGDVYKRQVMHGELAGGDPALEREADRFAAEFLTPSLVIQDPVSYTHLTLPTIYSV